MFGNFYYTSAADLWSLGCIIAEMLMLKSLFEGENTHMILVDIIKKLGSPSEEEIKAMNPEY